MTAATKSPSDSPLGRFQELLRELFRFDCADLDFGIYRILNYKRDAIAKFIDTELPEAVGKALSTSALAAEHDASAKLDAAREQLLAALGPAALDADGALEAAYHETPLGKAYLDAHRAATISPSPDALASQVLNHLYAFFRRYYDSGDFISQRRYSKEARYAIPYNGEEVLLHWANADQYYVKTTEHLHDYQFRTPSGVRVCFKLRHANTEQDNTKGDTRFFIAAADDATWSSVAKCFTIPFEYRPVASAEAASLGTTSDTRHKSCLDNAIRAIRRVATRHPPVADALAAPASTGTAPDILTHHLRQYTRRNTSDFFIHKNLTDFLTRELDFYIKSDVLRLDTLASSGEPRAAALFRLMETVRSVGKTIIAFLAQVEDFQKSLWEKRKFVTDTQYIVAASLIPTSLVEQVAETDAQWHEWERLGLLEPSECSPMTRVDLLAQRDGLPIDTRHFSADFTDCLLESVHDLDRQVNGLLIHSENWQALNLIQATYRDRARLTYIDPPFNTQDSAFLFRDRYRTSTWLQMMWDRLALGRALLADDGSHYLHLDHNSIPYGRLACDALFGRDSLLNEIVWRIGWVSGYKTAPPRFVRNHETLLLYGMRGRPFFRKDAAKIPYRGFKRATIEPQLERIADAWKLPKQYRRKLNVHVLTPDGVSYRTALTTKEGRYNVEDTWNCSDYESLHSNKIKRNAAEYTPHGSEITQKPEQLLYRILSVSSERGDHVLDYFGGSGTTAAVALKMGRKFVSVEMAQYFDSDMLWRIKTAIGGRRVGVSDRCDYAGGGLVKYIRLESYEDALSGMEFGGRGPGLFGGEAIRYALGGERGVISTSLGVGALERPFDYSLDVRRDGVARRRTADVPETFNFLIGLLVRTRRVYDRDGRRVLVLRGETREGTETVVIWRDIAGWEPEEFDREREWVTEQGFTGGAETIYVNGDSVIDGAESLDPVFKERMFAPVPA